MCYMKNKYLALIERIKAVDNGKLACKLYSGVGLTPNENRLFTRLNILRGYSEIENEDLTRQDLEQIQSSFDAVMRSTERLIKEYYEKEGIEK